jgi:hypothetical protein
VPAAAGAAGDTGWSADGARDAWFASGDPAARAARTLSLSEMTDSRRVALLESPLSM